MTARNEAYFAAQAAKANLGDTIGDRSILPDLVETLFDRADGAIALRTITDKGTGSVTMSAAEMLAGMVEGTPGGASNYTTDTATALVAAIPNAAVGTSFAFFINNKSGANAITVLAGGGVTLDGPVSVAVDAVRKFVGTVTAIGTPAVTIWGVT